MGQSANPMSRPGQSGASDDSDDISVTPETENLRRDIEHTRTDMSETLDAIQQRLNPETIGEQAKDTASDITAQAKEAALEVIDHALAEVKEQATEVLGQAREVLVEARIAAREVVEDTTTQVKAAVRGATIGKVETMVRSANDTTNAARHGLVATIKANPFPAALTGLGLGWLFINSRSAAARGSMDSRSYEADYREQRSASTGASLSYGAYQGSGNVSAGRGSFGATIDRSQAPSGGVAGQAGDLAGRAGGAVGDAAGQVGDLAGRAGGAVGDAVGQVGQTAGDIAGQVGQTASNIVGQVGETAGNIASGTMETAGNIAEQAQYQALRLEDGFQRALRESPLAVGAVTLALGTAIGLALPQTARENQLMGEARDGLLERAQDFAQETVEKVQGVATEVTETVTETAKTEAKKQGLTQ